jgi:hypothetical protein
MVFVKNWLWHTELWHESEKKLQTENIFYLSDSFRKGIKINFLNGNERNIIL